jgi:hypothetical protein
VHWGRRVGVHLRRAAGCVGAVWCPHMREAGRVVWRWLVCLRQLRAPPQTRCAHLARLRCGHCIRPALVCGGQVAQGQQAILHGQALAAHAGGEAGGEEQQTAERGSGGGGGHEAAHICTEGAHHQVCTVLVRCTLL